MKQIITTLEFESLEDRELTVINSVFKLFEMLSLDENEKTRVCKYLNERVNNSYES